jgi:hypothetical protein
MHTNPHDGINPRGKRSNSRMTAQFVDIALAAISEPTKKPELLTMAALFLSHPFGTLRARLGPELGLGDDRDE